MSKDRHWSLYVRDMLESCERVTSYTAGMDQATFVRDTLSYDATLRNLSVLGEAATHIPRGIRAAHAEIPWRQIIGTRNRLVHAYLKISNDVLWSIIRDDIPPLVSQLAELLKEAEGEARPDTA